MRNEELGIGEVGQGWEANKKRPGVGPGGMGVKR